MVLNLAFIMGIIGAMIALVIGVIIFSSITDAINCDEITYEEAKQQCESATSTAWIVIGILPVALFFVLFNIFGGLGGDYDEPRRPRTKNLMEELLGKNKKGMSLKDKRKRSKEKQRLADEEMLRHNNDLVQHSFLTKWLRRKN